MFKPSDILFFWFRCRWWAQKWVMSKTGKYYEWQRHETWSCSPNTYAWSFVGMLLEVWSLGSFYGGFDGVWYGWLSEYFRMFWRLEANAQRRPICPHSYSPCKNILPKNKLESYDGVWTTVFWNKPDEYQHTDIWSFLESQVMCASH